MFLNGANAILRVIDLNFFACRSYYYLRLRMGQRTKCSNIFRVTFFLGHACRWCHLERVLVDWSELWSDLAPGIYKRRWLWSAHHNCTVRNGVAPTVRVEVCAWPFAWVGAFDMLICGQVTGGQVCVEYCSKSLRFVSVWWLKENIVNSQAWIEEEESIQPISLRHSQHQHFTKKN